MTGTDEPIPATVPTPPARGKRAGEVEPVRSTAETPVWTKRMLATLAKGVTGGKWNAFFDGRGLFSLRSAHVAARQSSCR